MGDLHAYSRHFGLYIGLIIFLTLAVTKTKTQDSYYFDPAPIDQDVVEGEDVRLRCDVSNRAFIMFYWTLDNKPVSNTSRRYQDESDLRIMRVSRNKDKGSFRCVATNASTGISTRSLDAKLNVLWLDKNAEVQLRNPTTEEEIVAGTNVTLKCQVEGNPPPEVEWYKNEIRLFASDRVKYSSTSKERNLKNRVKLMGVTADDNGVFSCRAKNRADVITSTDNFLLNMRGQDTAQLNLDTFTKSLLVKKNGLAKFNCQYSNALITEWYYNERLIANSTKEKTRVFPNGTLVVHQVRPRDAGTYKCVGISESGLVQTFTSKLTLAYIDDFTEDSFEPKLQENTPQVVPNGQKFEVRCRTPEGLPPPLQKWSDPSKQEVALSGRVRVQDGSLIITDAEEGDSGNYTCSAENMAAERTATVWVVVSIAPTIANKPLSMRVEEGESASFTCVAVGTPYPVTTVTWSKDNVPVDPTHPRFVMDPKEGSLLINEVHLSDEGNYACVVNTIGQTPVISDNAHLYIIKKLKFLPPPVDKILELGSKSKVHCRADGEMVPQVHWRKEGPVSLEQISHVKDSKGVLKFDGVLHADRGNYTCVASNSQGQISATISIDVVVKPRFKVKPINTTAYEGFPVMLHCVAIGEPTPAVKWDRNGYMDSLDPNRFRKLPNGSLSVSEVFMEDMGKYGCTAGNSGGFEREEIYLHVTSGENYIRRMHNKNAPEEDISMMKTIIIAVCSAVAYLAVVIGLTVYCSIRLVKQKNLRKAALQNTLPGETVPALAAERAAENGIIPTENTELMDKKERDSSILKSDDARSHASGVSSHQSHSSRSQHSGSSRRRSYDKLNFPRHDLQTLGMLGKGIFGDVFLAKAHGIRDGEQDTLVVVKSLLSRDEHHHFEFRREIDMFGKLNHEHIVRLLGVCREMEPQFIITEYCEWGDLKQFLWATRKDNIKRNPKLPPLTIAQKITMCNQIVLGLEHLANHRIVHKDVAARNVLLSPNLDIKLSNLGLCRDVYAMEYFPFHQHIIPLRWMPPEAVLEDEYSTKSDVFAFGVYCWEVFTLGDLPHHTRTDEEVLKGLKSGDYRLEPVPTCPEEIVEVIRKCTIESPKDRPSFSELAVMIGELTVDSDV